jgi:hypothetical protein
LGSTFPGNRFGDPNSASAGLIGFDLNNLLDNKMTILALSHIGAEQAPNGDLKGYTHDLRACNNAAIT